MIQYIDIKVEFTAVDYCWLAGTTSRTSVNGARGGSVQEGLWTGFLDCLNMSLGMGQQRFDTVVTQYCNSGLNIHNNHLPF